MPPKSKSTRKKPSKTGASTPTSGAKRKREEDPQEDDAPPPDVSNRPQIQWTKEMRAAKLKEAQENQKKIAAQKALEKEASESPPKKKRKPTPKAKGPVASSASRSPARAASRRSKDPPRAAGGAMTTTPPRPSGASHTNGRPGFNSPTPNTDSKRRSARKKSHDDDDSEDDDGDNHRDEIPLPPSHAAAGRRGRSQNNAPNNEPDDSGDDSSSESDDSEGDDENLAALENELDELGGPDRPYRPELGDDLAAPNTSTWLIPRIIFFALIAVGVLLPASVRDTVFPTIRLPLAVSHVCFKDSPHLQHEESVATSTACLDENGPISWQDCPSDAYCRGGKLLSCPDGFVVEPRGCSPSAESKEALHAMIGLLRDWTTQDMCKGHPERRKDPGYGNRPLFHYSRVTGELEMGYNPGLVKLANHSRFLLSSSSSGDVWIGLHPKVHIPLSYACHSKLAVRNLLNMLLALVGAVLEFAWELAADLISQYLSEFWHAPVRVFLATVSAVVVTSLALRKYKRNRARKQVENDIFQCRELALDLLSNTPSGRTMEQVAEHVAWKQYPMSRKGATESSAKSCLGWPKSCGPIIESSLFAMCPTVDLWIC